MTDPNAEEQDDPADELVFGPRIEAARALMREHHGCVEIRLDKSGQIYGFCQGPRYSRGLEYRQSSGRQFRQRPREPQSHRYNDPSLTASENLS